MHEALTMKLISKLAYCCIAVSLLASIQSAFAEDVRLVKEGGVYHLPVRINDAIELKFVVDTGAAVVLIPADVALTLVRTGTITEADFRGTGSYRMADGTIAENTKLNLRSLQIGSLLLRNVEASVGPVEGSLLLGQSALEKLEPWRMETKRGVFVFGDHAANYAGQPHQEPPSTPWSLESGVIYFAAELPPTENIPPEAPLCYKFQVASPDEQLKKLKKKYPDLYGYKITKNSDGTHTLVAKRKDESGLEVAYFYTTNPSLCNEYQAKKLNATPSQLSSNISSPSDDFGWVLVATSVNEDEVYVARRRIEQDGAYRKIWQKNIQQVVDKWGAKSIVAHHLFDCGKKKRKSLGGVVYDEHNKVIDKFGGEDKWEMIIPDTVGWSAFEYACEN